MGRHCRFVSALFIVLSLGMRAESAVNLPPWVSDGAVLQTNAASGIRAQLWGWSDRNSSIEGPESAIVTVTCVPVAAGSGNLTVQAPVNATTGLFVARLLATITPGSGCLLLAFDDGDAHAAPVLVHNLTFGDVLLCMGGRGMALPVSQATAMPAAPTAPHQVRYFDGAQGLWVDAFNNDSVAAQRPALCLATGSRLLSTVATNPPTWDSGRWPSTTIGLLPLLDVDAGLREWAAPAAIKTCLPVGAVTANDSAAYNALVEPLMLLHFRAALLDVAGPPLVASEAPRNASQVACLLQETVHSWRATAIFGDFPVIISDLGSTLPSSQAVDTRRVRPGRSHVDVTRTDNFGGTGHSPHSSDTTDTSNGSSNSTSVLLAAARVGFGMLAPSKAIQLTAVIPAADLSVVVSDGWAIGDKDSQGTRTAAAIMHISTGYLPPAVNASGPRPYNASQDTSSTSSIGGSGGSGSEYTVVASEDSDRSDRSDRSASRIMNGSGSRGPPGASRGSASVQISVLMAADGWLDPDGGDPASNRSLALTGNASTCGAGWDGLDPSSGTWQPASAAIVHGTEANQILLAFDFAPSSVRYGARAQQVCLLLSVATRLPAASFEVVVAENHAAGGTGPRGGSNLAGHVAAGAAADAAGSSIHHAMDTAASIPARLLPPVPPAVVVTPPAGGSNGTRVAQTPPMGWETWNAVHALYGENTIRQMADALNTSGLSAFYKYLIVDEWASKQRHPRTGKLVPNPARFPSGMASLAAYVRSKGLELGIYTTQGQYTCQRYAASCGFERVDAATFVREWGASYVFVDACGGCNAEDEWALWHAALLAEGAAAGLPPAVLEVNGCGSATAPCAHSANLYTNLFRIGGDLQFDFASIIAHIDQQAAMQVVNGPGSWAFADMLELQTPTLTLTEQAAEFLMWAFFPTPLLLGMDIRTLDAATHSLVLAPEVLAVNQDALGVPAKRVRGGPGSRMGLTDLWTRPLVAVTQERRGETPHAVQPDVGAAVFNRWPFDVANATVSWAELGLKSEQTAVVRDVYARRNLGSFVGGINVTVPAHGVVLLRVQPVTS